MLSEPASVGFAIAPPNAQAVFHRIEFVPLSSNRILVVVVASGNQVSQKTIDIGEAVTRPSWCSRQLPQLGIFRAARWKRFAKA